MRRPKIYVFIELTLNGATSKKNLGRGVDKGGGVRYIGKCATNEANRPEPRPNLEKPIV